MSIRTEIYPQESQGLLRYLQLIKNMHGQGRDAVQYDHLFRLTKEQHPSIQWGEYLAELADEIGATADRELPTVARRVDTGHCYRFNSPFGCKLSNCKYTHRCRSCGRGDHGATQCRAIQQRPNQSLAYNHTV